MAQQTEPSYPVIGPEFCSPTPVEFAIVRNFLGSLVIEDHEDNFKLQGTFFSLHDKRTVVDAAGNPIVTLQAKIFTAHYRWEVFRGESTDTKDLIFSAKTTSMIPLKIKLKVFLANNTSEDVCDYKLKGSWSDRSCTIYKGESSTIVAKMSKKFTPQSLLLKMDKFMVTVSPNFDYAFVAALIVILDAINQTKVDAKFIAKKGVVELMS